MGRPISKKLIGNLTADGNQIRVYGIINAIVGIEELFIVKQKNAQKFLCASAAVPTRTGIIVLQDLVPVQAGEGRIFASAFGSGGDVAVAVATMKVQSVQTVSSGTGYTTNDVLTLVGGAFASAATLTVTQVGLLGDILAVSIVMPGTNYTTLPIDAISVTGGTGTAATFSAKWNLFDVNVVLTGDGYLFAPSVQIIGDGTAASVSSVIVANKVTDINVTSSGTGFDSIPQLVVQSPNIQTVKKVLSKQIKTFSGNIYFYDIKVLASIKGLGYADLVAR